MKENSSKNNLRSALSRQNISCLGTLENKISDSFLNPNDWH